MPVCTVCCFNKPVLFNTRNCKLQKVTKFDSPLSYMSIFTSQFCLGIWQISRNFPFMSFASLQPTTESTCLERNQGQKQSPLITYLFVKFHWNITSNFSKSFSLCRYLSESQSSSCQLWILTWLSPSPGSSTPHTPISWPKLRWIKY